MRLDLIVRNRINSAKYAKNRKELSLILSDLVNSLNFSMEKRHKHVLLQAKTAIKGLKSISENMDNDMAFMCGQYAALIDSMVDIYRSNVHMDSINEIMSTNTAQTIAKYLWINKCSEIEKVLSDTQLNKELFDIYIDEMITLKLVRNDVGPDCEWVELSADGYTYMRKHYFEKEGFNIW